MRYYFRNREHHRLFFGLVATASNLHTFHKSLYQDFFRFGESLCNGRLYLLFRIHLRHPEAGTAQTGLDETRQAYLLNHIFVGNRLPLAKQQRVGDTHTERFQILIAGKLIIRQCGRKHSATGIRYMKHIEISLQTPVLTRSSVNGDICKIEYNLRAVQPEAEIITVYRSFRTVGKLHVPVRPLHLYYI